MFLYWASRQHEIKEPGAGLRQLESVELDIFLLFYLWSNIFLGVVAGWAASRLSRACAAQAFSHHGRSTTTTDLIMQIESAFSRLYESETSL